ncbi:MAG: acyl-CoA dehydrogenase [Alphaproteobacteria bacterium]|nr:acyl-CoA dehydrogenase [Alphaproteobacteria bacterium]
MTNVVAHRKASSVPTRAELIDRARALVPMLRADAIATERRRTLSTEVINALFAAGLFRVFQPARYGGWQMEWGTQYDLGRVIARGCPSTAWIVCVVGTHAGYVARFPMEAQDEVWGDDHDVLIATGSVQRPGASVKRVAGGFVLNGSWGFASGVDHAKWGMAAGRIEGEPEPRQFLFPRKDFVVSDTWHVAGMKGTGTKDIELHETFVPDHRALLTGVFNGANPPGGAVHDHYLYRVEFRPFSGSGLLGPIMGAAEAAYEEYVAMTRVKQGAIFKDKVADNPAVQMRVAESAAELAAARALADQTYDLLNARGKAGQSFSDEDRVMVMRDRAFVMKLCLQSAERLVRMMGALGLHDDNPVQRCFRDLHAMAAQIGVNWDVNMAPYGKWALGIPLAPTWGAVQRPSATPK